MSIMVDKKSLVDIRLTREHLEGSLIFLDRYDELYLTLQEHSKNTISFLEDLKNLAINWNLRFIITSRRTCINPSDLYKNGYKVCQLIPLTENEQKKWINDTYNELFPEKIYDTNKMYNSHTEIQSKVLELLGILILLQLVVSEHFYGDAQNIVELYDKLFEKILYTRIDNSNKTKDFKQVFEEFAYNIYKNNDKYDFIESKELEKNKNEKWKAILLFYIKKQENKKNIILNLSIVLFINIFKHGTFII